MSFNLFGPATKDSIRVGYISTERGFVDGVTVCEANDYAKLNPGVRFIFKTRDSIRYLGINDVNNLSPNDLASSEGECPGIQLEVDCGPAQAFFYGGGGVGVLGNPVIGADGSVLAVDLVAGGFGYQYPPIVEVKDSCGIGAGAVIRSILGEITETFEVYDQEDDFEEYEICDPSDVGFGRRFGPNGEDLGPWEPSLYANLDEDPIRREIRDYQNFLASLRGGFRINKNDNIIHNWWTTRKEPPLRLTASNKVTRTKFDVTDASFLEKQRNDGVKDPVGWNDFMNAYAISPVPPSNVPGSDFAGIPFTFEWEEDFPYDGEYVFRGLCDNQAQLYLDNVLLDNLQGFKNTPNKIKKNIKEGVHRIRLDLFNIPVAPKAQDLPKNIFNTIAYINKADRRLWRTFPSVGRDGDFIHQYGVTPFDPNTSEANTNSFAGTHVIRWENIKFPVDGNYTIELMVDDNVTLYIGNRAGGGDVAIGNGLRSIENGGDETIIRKRGFSSPTQSTGKSIETRFFKAGKYRIRAELEQIKGKPLAQGNPMALAININSVGRTEAISARSWNENPMGVALTIDAPLPPIPQEPIVEQEGRCPRNPIWTTRFPGSSEKWFPVRFGEAWSRFMNRYAISPVIPLPSKGSDGGGVVYRNSWNIDIPYDGFYGLRGTVDNGGRILIDSKEVARGGGLSFRGRTVGQSGLDGFRVENPQTTKVFLTKGSPRIEVEVENEKTDTFVQIDKKIFDTKDWVVTPTPPPAPAPVQSQREEWVKVDDAFILSGDKKSYHRFNEGTWYKGKRIRAGGDWNDTNVNNNYIEWDKDTRLTLGSYRASAGQRFAISVWKRKIISTQTAATKPVNAVTNSTLSKGGVTYSGPELASYRNGALGPFLTPAFNGDDDYRANNMDRKWTLRWSNVDFPEDGRYDLKAEADDYVIVRVDGEQVGKAEVFEGVRSFSFNASKGKRTIELEIYNIPGNDESTFETNPVVFNVVITKKVNVLSGISEPWTRNPVGISAILIPPPCPKRIRGRGVVVDVEVDDPGNGYPIPQGDAYPVALRLKSVVVENSGINYNCGVDQIQISPNNGAILDYECDSFGRITNVKVLNPGLGFTRYPEITMVSPDDSPTGPTGVNASFRPQFEVVRDPIVIDPERLIQVTDLVGLKQTGYVDGRSYFGAVFYKEGVRYAGFYETPGELVQVYDTLQESIDAQVTTRPSAIQRQGTDTNSNNPRLNLPGTTDNLT